MDENHNEIDMLAVIQEDTTVVGNGDEDDASPRMDENSMMKPSSEFTPKFHSNFEKIKHLEKKGLLFTQDVLKQKFDEGITVSKMLGSGEVQHFPESTNHPQEENDEALLYLYVNRRFGPAGDSSLINVKNSKEFAAILEKEPEHRAQHLEIHENEKYKELYHKILSEFKGFKQAIQNSVSMCQNEMEITVESLVEAHQKALDDLRGEKQELQCQLRRANREILDFTCRIEGMKADLVVLRNQLLEKDAEADGRHLDEMRLKERCEGLNHAHNAMFEQMTGAEQRNAIYKAQLNEIQEHNTSLLNSIAKMYDEHADDIKRLKDQIDLTERETSRERMSYTQTIAELTDTCERLVSYSKEVLMHTKLREAEFLKTIGHFSTQTAGAVNQSSSAMQTKTEAEKNLDVQKQELNAFCSKCKDYKTRFSSVGVQYVPLDMEEASKHKNELKAEDVFPNLSANVLEMSDEIGFSKIEARAEIDRLTSRIRQLENMNQENMEKIQRSAAKYRKLYDKYVKCREASDRKSDQITEIRKYSESLEAELRPVHDEQFILLEKQMNEALLKHAQFGALLEGIHLDED